MKKKFKISAALSAIFLFCSNPADEDHRNGPGSLTVTIEASGVTPRVQVRGPDTTVLLTASAHLDSLTPGTYIITAYRVDLPPTADELTGKAYGDTLPLKTVTVANGKTASADVRYAEQPASGKLWVANNLGGTILGFRREDLAVPSSPLPAATLSLDYNYPKGIAFDSLGFLWVACFSKNKIRAFRPAALATAGSPNRTNTAVLAATAISNPFGLAFDRRGALWIANWTSNTIIAYTRPQLELILSRRDTADATAPDIVIASSDVKQPEYLAFDHAGNLWVACDDPSSGASRLFMFAAANLAVSGTPSPAIKITPLGTDLIGVSGLAFDHSGNLWGTQSAAFFELPANTLAASGSAAPVLSRKLVQPGALAFDANGNLWISDEKSQIVRYVPGTAGSGSNFNTSSALDYPTGLSFYPPPPGYAIP